mgnify:CR=1 FL=1
MKDNVKASILQADGTYTKPDKRGKMLVNSQEYFCREATERAEKPKEQENSRVCLVLLPAALKHFLERTKEELLMRCSRSSRLL